MQLHCAWLQLCYGWLAFNGCHRRQIQHRASLSPRLQLCCRLVATPLWAVVAPAFDDCSFRRRRSQTSCLAGRSVVASPAADSSIPNYRLQHHQGGSSIPHLPDPATPMPGDRGCSTCRARLQHVVTAVVAFADVGSSKVVTGGSNHLRPRVTCSFRPSPGASCHIAVSQTTHNKLWSWG